MSVTLETQMMQYHMCEIIQPYNLQTENYKHFNLNGGLAKIICCSLRETARATKTRELCGFLMVAFLLL